MAGRTHIPTLDGWRAIAVLLVLASHFGGQLDDSVVSFQIGHFGVNVFFAISGYLICTLLLDEQDRFGRVSLEAFYIRRAFRILPLVTLYLAALAALWLLGWLRLTGLEFLSSLFFLRNYQASGTWYTAHFWSLAVEEHFYLLLPAAIVWLGRRRLLYALPAVALSIGAWRILVGRFNASAFAARPYRTDFQLDAILWACWLAVLLSDPAARRKLKPWLTPAAAGIGAILGVILPHDFVTLSYAGFAVMVVATVSNSGSLLGRFLELPPLRSIGRLSFSLYVWQQLFSPRAYVEHLPHAALQTAPANLIAVCVLALLSYYAVERPCLRLGRRISDRLTGAALAAAA